MLLEERDKPLSLVPISKDRMWSSYRLSFNSEGLPEIKEYDGEILNQISEFPTYRLAAKYLAKLELKIVTEEL